MTTHPLSRYVRFSKSLAAYLALVATVGLAAFFIVDCLAVAMQLGTGFAAQPAAIVMLFGWAAVSIVAWMPSIGFLAAASAHSPNRDSEGRQLAIGAAAGQLAAVLTLALAAALWWFS